MSMARLSAGAGYQYLVRDTCCADTHRDAGVSLTSYYAASGYPPGHWHGSGLAGFGTGPKDEGTVCSVAGLAAGSVVSEEQMQALYGCGRDPVSGVALGRAYPTYRSLTDRIAAATDRLPADLDTTQRVAAVAEITAAETGRRMPVAVAGFDLTFTVPKSLSVLWALADPATQHAIASAHRGAVADAVAFVEQHALFTRVGAKACVQVPTRGLVAAGFEHWDTRTADPNLHTHVVIANKVQGLDGTWRSLDSRALHHAVVAVSELYDDLIADKVTAALRVSWEWRDRGPRRTPAFEVHGVADDLLAEFSTRSRGMDAHVREEIAAFTDRRGRAPTRAETSRLRQRVTRATRPPKTVHPLRELFALWRDRALRRTGLTPEQLTALALHGTPPPRRHGLQVRSLRDGQIPVATVDLLAGEVIDRTMQRRATWTRWNLTAEAARATRGLRMATTTDRIVLHTRIVDAALTRCVSLQVPDAFTTPAAYRRPDGSSMFMRPDDAMFTDIRVMDAEQRLLTATDDTTGPITSAAKARRIATTPQHLTPTAMSAVVLQADQVDAVVTIASSGRRLDVLVGPAGTGKTTTLRALLGAWEATHGHGSVLGLAPSATAAAELGAALGVGCENTAKWLHETVGPGAQHRTAAIDDLNARATAVMATDPHAAVRARATADLVRRDHLSWQLRPGHLVIVDEASLAGTFTLDTLLTQATAAGAKLLLVGDHHQLTAVDAGGAFGLLATTPGAQELTSLWRFRRRWEADTSRLLRAGDPTALDAYQAHGRISSGPCEVMIDAAYTAWRDDEASGRSAILLAADTTTVTVLNTRAHDDRITAGLVAPTGVTAADGHTIGVGDRVVTRCNNRRLRLPGRGFVRNGALWNVTALGPDGSLTLTPTGHYQPKIPTPTDTSDAAPPVVAATVRVPAAYVRAHVELGYACTVHRAQGVTVDAAHVLASPGITRQALYVAMTRGRALNHVYVATDTPDINCEPVPDPGFDPTGRDILERILTTDGTERSATHTLRAHHDQATSLATLVPIRATLLADADTRRWRSLLPECGLTGTQVEEVFHSPAAGALLAALRAAETDGHPMPGVLRELITTRPLPAPANADTPAALTQPAAQTALEPADDLAAILHQRVSTWHDHQPPLPMPEGHAGRVDPGATTLRLFGIGEHRLDPADPLVPVLAEIDDLLRGRLRAITTDAITARPGWMQPLGTEPAPSNDSRRWRDAVATIAAYRDLLTVTSVQPLGPETSRDRVDRRRRTLSGYAAGTATRLGHPDPHPNPYIRDRSLTR